MYIGYFKDQDLINEKNPNLNFSISEMPQLTNSNVNFGKIYGFMVSKQSKNASAA